MTDVTSEPESAADAFNALRTEIAVGLRRVELALHELAGPGRGGGKEDMLGRIAEQVIATRATVESIAESPTLRPRIELRSHPVVIPDEAKAIITAVEHLYEGARCARDQRRAMVRAFLIGITSGAVLWATCAGPLASIAPVRWHWPERMAARTLRADLTDAGLRLFSAADPLLAQDLAAGLDIVAINRPILQSCIARANRSRRAQFCVLSIKPS
jgi:hypothetical protein